MLKKIQSLETEKDQNITLIIDLERDLKYTREEKERQIKENAKLIEEMLKLRKEIDSLSWVNMLFWANVKYFWTIKRSALFR